MTLSDLASVGSLVSGVAVLVSLIYLGLQARQNTASFNRAENNATQAQASIFRLAVIENREVAVLWTNGLKDGAALDEPDELRFDAMLSEVFWTNFHNWDRARSGVFGKDTPNGWLAGLATILTSARGTRWWQNNRANSLTEFAVAVDQAIIELQTASAAPR